jgi:hypothetical protein
MPLYADIYADIYIEHVVTMGNNAPQGGALFIYIFIHGHRNL